MKIKSRNVIIIIFFLPKHKNLIKIRTFVVHIRVTRIYIYKKKKLQNLIIFIISVDIAMGVLSPLKHPV